jgi:hypothetical protein
MSSRSLVPLVVIPLTAALACNSSSPVEQYFNQRELVYPVHLELDEREVPILAIEYPLIDLTQIHESDEHKDLFAAAKEFLRDHMTLDWLKENLEGGEAFLVSGPALRQVSMQPCCLLGVRILSYSRPTEGLDDLEIPYRLINEGGTHVVEIGG